jgi:hypothetical protein
VTIEGRKGGVREKEQKTLALKRKAEMFYSLVESIFPSLLSFSVGEKRSSLSCALAFSLFFIVFLQSESENENKLSVWGGGEFCFNQKFVHCVGDDESAASA